MRVAMASVMTQIFRFTNPQKWGRLYLTSLLLVFLPFLGARLLRMAGDEKIYVSQALEMEANSSWFLQRFLDEPNYYKGPWHYLLLRLGFLILGHHPATLIYMNLILLALGGWALGTLVNRRLPDWKIGPFWTSLLFTLGLGTYSMAFASQMDAGLMGLFAISLFLLDQLTPKQAGFRLWLTIGLIGWLKAPLHSLLAGTSVLLFWVLQGEWVGRLKHPRSLLAIFTGVAVGIAGYLPAALSDWKVFQQTYLLRELFHRPSNGRPWWDSLYGPFSFYFFPWMGIAWVSWVHSAVAWKNWWSQPKLRRLFLLCLAWVIPSFLFFSIGTSYRCEHYNLPVLSALVLWVSVSLSFRPPRWQIADRWTTYVLTTLPFLAALVVPDLLLFLGFQGFPETWTEGTTSLWYSLGLSIALACLPRFLKVLPSVHHTSQAMTWLFLCVVSFYASTGLLLKNLGEFELQDLRSWTQHHPGRPLSYWNLKKHLWHEWGILQFWLGQPISSLHTEAHLHTAVTEQHGILLSARDGSIPLFKEWMQAHYPHVSYALFPWRRWRTQGKDATGRFYWSNVWQEKSLVPLQEFYAIVSFSTPPADSLPGLPSL